MCGCEVWMRQGRQVPGCPRSTACRVNCTWWDFSPRRHLAAHPGPARPGLHCRGHPWATPTCQVVHPDRNPVSGAGKCALGVLYDSLPRILLSDEIHGDEPLRPPGSASSVWHLQIFPGTLFTVSVDSRNSVCVTQKNGGMPTWSVCQGCHRKLPQTGWYWVAQTTETGFLTGWKSEGQGVCRTAPSEAPLLAWQVAVFSLPLRMGFPSIPVATLPLPMRTHISDYRHLILT